MQVFLRVHDVSDGHIICPHQRKSQTNSRADWKQSFHLCPGFVFEALPKASLSRSVYLLFNIVVGQVFVDHCTLSLNLSVK